MASQSEAQLYALALDELRGVSFPPVHPLENEAWPSTVTLTTQSRLELKAIRDTCEQISSAFAELLVGPESPRLGWETKYESQMWFGHKRYWTRTLRLSAAIAPCKMLPPEILSRIFAIEHGNREYYIPRVKPCREKQDLFNQKVKDAYPEHVCSFWRQVALSTPALYHRVGVVYEDDLLIEETAEITALAKQIIARGTRALHLDLGRLPLSICKRIFQQLIVPFQHRFTNLSATHYEPDPRILDAYASLLPVLPQLKVFKEFFYDDAEIASLLFNLPNVPSAFWGHLEEVSIGSSTSDAFLTLPSALYLLQRCPQLKKCWLSIGTPEEGADANSSRLEEVSTAVSFPNLEHFQVHSHVGSVDLSPFLRPLTLPAIQKFRLFVGFRPVDTIPIRSLIERSRCNLKALRIEESTLSETDLKSLLPGLSTVEELALPGVVIPTEIMGRISSAEYLPRLQCLEMGADPAFLVSTTEEITALAESRWKHANGADIRHIQCWFHDHVAVKPSFPTEYKQKWESQNRIIRIQYIEEILDFYPFA